MSSAPLPRSDIGGAIEYLAAASALAARLAEHRRTLFELQFFGLSFGSWTMVAGTAKRRVRLTWDGREGELTADVAQFADSRDQPAWQPVAQHRVPDRAPEALWQLAEHLVLTQSGAPAA